MRNVRNVAAKAISLCYAQIVKETEKFIVPNAMAPGTIDVSGVTVLERNSAHLVVVEAGRNAGVALDPGKSVVLVATEPAMICGTTNVHGVGVLGIKTVHHVLGKDMTNVSLVMVPGIKIVHGVGDEVIRIVANAMAQEQLNVNVARDMANSVLNVRDVMVKVGYIIEMRRL